MRCLLPVLMATGMCVSAIGSAAFASDAMTPLELDQVKVGGEIGRRIDLTVRGNLLLVDVEKDFLGFFRTNSAASWPNCRR